MAVTTKKKHNVMSTSIPLWSKFEGLLHKRLPQTFKQLQPSKFDNVVVALSSGVDSSLAAALYSGFPNVHAVYMRNWSNKDVPMLTLISVRLREPVVHRRVIIIT